MYLKAFESQEEENYKLYIFISNIIQLLKGQIKDRIFIGVELKNRINTKKKYLKRQKIGYIILE